MPRYKLTIEYDGTPFVGWQKQTNGPSVQGQIEVALERLTGERATPFGAGRTDAGVHALGQVAHIDLTSEWETDKIRDGLNYHLRPDPVVILEAQKVHDAFEARFSATQRSYQYIIINRRPRPTLDFNRAWHVPKHLDVSAMNLAAQNFVGHHDFTTFRSAQCQAKSPLKSIDSMSVVANDRRIVCTVSARSFMHNQVRSMVGSLVEVGLGKWSTEDISKALKAVDRAACGPVAPAYGLYFLDVTYDT